MSFNQIHVSDQALAGQIEGNIRKGVGIGTLAAADLATDAATAKANVDTRVAASGLHSTDKNAHVIPTKQAIDKLGLLSSTAVSGGSVQDIYDAAPGTWPAEDQFLG